MKRLLLVLSSLLFFAALMGASAQESSGRQLYRLTLLLDGQPLHWDAGEGVTRNGDLVYVDDPTAMFPVYFEGGWLELRPADFGTFAQPHVTGFRFIRDADPESFSMGATVHHRDAGFDDYTDAIVFDGAENGRLVLSEALGGDGSEGFTRSKDGVRATGQVRISALDSVRSGDGSAIVVDFSQAPFSQRERGNLRYELTLVEADGE